MQGALAISLTYNTDNQRAEVFCGSSGSRVPGEVSVTGKMLGPPEGDDRGDWFS